MIKQVPAQIYKSDLRGAFKTKKHNCFATFNFENYQDVSRKPFGTLQILNEEILAPQQSVSRLIKANTNVVILPLFGGIEYKDNLGNSDFLRVEQISVTAVDYDTAIMIHNPYESKNVSYLQIDFQMDNYFPNGHFIQTELNLQHRNQLVSLFEVNKAIGFIGVYDGRKKGVYTLKNAANGVFVFVINGAFEVEDRLLEAKDGLSIEKVEKIEWEALSENAVLLIFEVNLI